MLCDILNVGACGARLVHRYVVDVEVEGKVRSALLVLLRLLLLLLLLLFLLLLFVC